MMSLETTTKIKASARYNNFTAAKAEITSNLNQRGEFMSEAIISRCEKYRYLLKRACEVKDPEAGTALFIMLNPSTADAQKDDATIRRLRGFARSWQCNGLIVANLYAFRSTNPKNLWLQDDPVGPENNDFLTRLLNEYGDAICAWGANAKPDRVKDFLAIAKASNARLWCLGTTKSGAPKHPLYVRSDQALIRWNSDQWLCYL